MDVDGVWSWVEGYQIFFQLTNTANSAFKSLLNEDSFLWVDHLVVALFEFSINVDVLDVEACQMLEGFIRLPSFNILNT